MSKVNIEFKSKGNAAKLFNAIIEDYYYSAKNSEDKDLIEQYASITYEINKGGKINAKRLAKLLTDALDDGDTNTIWYVIGELEKAAK
jgi:hypothetical protein